MSGDPKDLSAWVGRRERSEDVIGPGPVTRLSATLDRDDAPPEPGDACRLCHLTDSNRKAIQCLVSFA